MVHFTCSLELALEDTEEQVEPPLDRMLAVLDTACIQTMHGHKWRLPFEEKLRHIGLKPTFSHKKRLLLGVLVAGPSVPCWSKFPVGIGGFPGEIGSHSVAGDQSLLFSRETMAQFGTKIDFTNGT